MSKKKRQREKVYKTPMTDGDKAYCAVAWAGGEGQKSLARTFGYQRPSTINVAIADFIIKYHPPGFAVGTRFHRSDDIYRHYRSSWPTDPWCHAYLHDRKSLIPAALASFKETLELRHRVAELEAQIERHA